MDTDIEIISIDNTDRRFYRLMGPLIARRSIEKEIGGRIYDDDGKCWFIALRRDQVVGFCSALVGKASVHYASSSVIPEFRRHGLYRALCQVRDAAFSGVPATITCHRETLSFFRSIGFKLAHKKGSFYALRRG